MLDKLVRRSALGAEVLPAVRILLVGEIFVARLSSTVTSIPQAAEQYLQKVYGRAHHG